MSSRKRRAWLLIALAGAGAGGAAESSRTMVQFRVYDETAPRWADSLWRDPVGACAPGASATADTTSKCVANYIMVRNDEAAPIVCRLALGLVTAKKKGAEPEVSAVETVEVIYPGKHHLGLVLMGTSTQEPAGYSVECYPEGASVETTAESMRSCLAKFDIDQARRMEFYYPEISQSMREEGNAIVEFYVDAASGKVARASIFKSSQYARLDKASVKMVGDLRTQRMCGDFAYRIPVRWRLGNLGRMHGYIDSGPACGFGCLNHLGPFSGYTRP